jgi:hypothetical protein
VTTYLRCIRLLQCGDEGGLGYLSVALWVYSVTLFQHHVPYTLEIALHSEGCLLRQSFCSHGNVVLRCCQRSSGLTLIVTAISKCLAAAIFSVGAVQQQRGAAREGGAVQLVVGHCGIVALQKVLVVDPTRALLHLRSRGKDFTSTPMIYRHKAQRVTC